MRWAIDCPPALCLQVAEAGAQVRALAARALGDVIAEQANLPEAFAQHLRQMPALEGRDRAFARELAWGTARLAPRLDYFVQTHLRQPTRRRDADVHALLLIGLYQLDIAEVPKHAAVNATVAAAPLLGKKWARGLVNAILRKLANSERALDTLPEGPKQALPQWLAARLRRAWPQDFEGVAAALAARPPFTLRAIDPEQSIAALTEAGGKVSRGALAPAALYLSPARDVDTLPGFMQGALSVQDEGAQLAASLLGTCPGERVLDACAAPGGKTLHIAQQTPDIDLVAIESDGRRAERISENLARAEAQCEVHIEDACDIDAWWDGRDFDRILIDAPCSATGILRRQPDIRLLRRESDIAKLAAVQGRLLEALWPLLKPGGVLLYCTCSVLPEEGPMIVEAFLAAHPEARAIPLRGLAGDAVRSTGPGTQLLPTLDRHDGFFYARLERRSG